MQEGGSGKVFAMFRIKVCEHTRRAHATVALMTALALPACSSLAPYAAGFPAMLGMTKTLPVKVFEIAGAPPYRDTGDLTGNELELELPAESWIKGPLCIRENYLQQIAEELSDNPFLDEKATLARYLATKFSRPLKQMEVIVNVAFEEAFKYEISPDLVLAVIQKESSFRPDARNPSGATGLMQVMPKYHADKIRHIRHPAGLFNPQSNIRVGVRILAEYLESADGDISRALRKYSGNARNYPQAVQRIVEELRQVKREALTVAAQERPPHNADEFPG